MLVSSACKHTPKYPGSLTPEESMKTFHFSDDSFKADLYAAEPLVKDPESMVFGEDGNVYVVEIPDANTPDSLKGHYKIIVLKTETEMAVQTHCFCQRIERCYHSVTMERRSYWYRCA